MKLKSLIEQRNDKITEMQGLVNSAKAETRTMSAEEMTKFETLSNEVAAIDSTIKAEERARILEIIKNDKKDEDKPEDRAVEEGETRAFANYIRGEVSENRAEVLSTTNNGAVIPKSIAKKIVETVIDLSPIYALSTKYTVKGELSFPVYSEATEAVTCAYATEFVALTSTSGKFTTVSLTGFLAGALSKISESLVNNSDFDLVNYVIGKMGDAIAKFLEKECLVGTAGKMTGILSSANGEVAAAATAVTADDLINLQIVVPEIYQAKAVWIMNKATFKAIRKLKDLNGQYILNKDLTMKFGWELLGKPVYISVNMPVMGIGKKAIAYGDMSGLYTKMPTSIDIKVLREKYADEHAIGVIGWVEADSKIVEPQKIAVLTMAAA